MNIKNYMKFGAFAALTMLAVACGSDNDSPAPVVPVPGSAGNAVDLGLSVKWADHNIGATTAEGYGNYYGWGDPTGNNQSMVAADYEKGEAASLEELFELCKTTQDAEAKKDTINETSYAIADWKEDYYESAIADGKIVYTKDGDDNHIFVAEVEITYTWNGNNADIYVYDITGNAEYDAAAANWGGTWRMPTSEEITELVEKCDWELTTQNGVQGYTVTGPNGKSIFLPLAGYRLGSEIVGQNQSGYYWSGVVDGTYTFPSAADQLDGAKGSISANNSPSGLLLTTSKASLNSVYANGLILGQTIRPVQD